MAPQGILPRSPLGGVEQPQTIKLIACGSSRAIFVLKQHDITRNPYMETYLKTLPVKMMMTLQENWQFQ